MQREKRIIPVNKKFPVRRTKVFTLYGEGSPGGKAGDLISKHNGIVESGLVVPQSVVLQTAFFNGFDLDDWGFDRIAVLDGLREDIFKSKVVNVAVRSSHLNESRGSGTYASRIVNLTGRLEIMMDGYEDYPPRLIETELGKGIKQVLESSNNDGKMAILIQPLITHLEILKKITPRYAGLFPLCSGCAWTTRYGDTGQGKISIVNGLGTKVVNVGGEVYLFDGKGELIKINDEPEPKTIDVYSSAIWKLNQKIRQGKKVEDERWNLGRIEVLSMLPGILKELERIIGRSQYIEFAYADGTLYCLQISDYIPLEGIKLEEGEKQGELLFSSRVVGGTGQVETKKIIVFDGKDPLKTIQNFDKETNEDYMVLFYSVAFSSQTRMRHVFEQMKQLKRMKGIIIQEVSGHTKDIGEHGINFFEPLPTMVISKMDHIQRSLGKPFRRNGMHFYPGDFLLFVDERKSFGELRKL